MMWHDGTWCDSTAHYLSKLKFKLKMYKYILNPNSNINVSKLIYCKMALLVDRTRGDQKNLLNLKINFCQEMASGGAMASKTSLVESLLDTSRPTFLFGCTPPSNKVGPAKVREICKKFVSAAAFLLSMGLLSMMYKT